VDEAEKNASTAEQDAQIASLTNQLKSAQNSSQPSAASVPAKPQQYEVKHSPGVTRHTHTFGKEDHLHSANVQTVAHEFAAQRHTFSERVDTV
jgi:hypothetical protein